MRPLEMAPSVKLLLQPGGFRFGRLGTCMAGRHGLNLRIGAYMLAIERVAAVHRLRGMYA